MPEPVQRLIVKSEENAVGLEGNFYLVSAMNYFPDKTKFTYEELKKIQDEGIQVSIRMSS